MNKIILLAWFVLLMGMYSCSASGPEYPNAPQDYEDQEEYDPRAESLDPCEIYGACDFQLEPDDRYADCDINGCPWDDTEERGAMDQPISCDVKGNISFSGEKIYHVPGQKYYANTTINPAYGERWFCTEDEARSAGWRRSSQ